MFVSQKNGKFLVYLKNLSITYEALNNHELLIRSITRRFDIGFDIL